MLSKYSQLKRYSNCNEIAAQLTLECLLRFIRFTSSDLFSSVISHNCSFIRVAHCTTNTEAKGALTINSICPPHSQFGSFSMADGAMQRSSANAL